jgi:hypothetical protein
MHRQKLVCFLIALASVGWLIPLWLGVESYIDGQTEAIRLLLHVQSQLNSFPPLGFSADCFALTFLWLAVVGLGWSYALSMWLIGVLWPNNSFKPKPLRGSA